MRGYNFSINSGAVEELEIDSFGLSIIPSSLVSWLLSKVNNTSIELHSAVTAVIIIDKKVPIICSVGE